MTHLDSCSAFTCRHNCNNFDTGKGCMHDYVDLDSFGRCLEYEMND